MQIGIRQRCGASLLIISICLVGQAVGQPPVDPLTAAIDKDNDGTVSAGELGQAAESLRSLDKNEDGKLTFDEIMPPFAGFGRGPRMEKRELVAEFDADGDGRLNREERMKARASESESRGALDRGGPGRGGRRGPGGFGPPGWGGRGARDPATPGPRVSPDDVKLYPDASLYDDTVLRTLFLDFEHDDWEKEMADFKDSDVDVPATLTVDGKVYQNIGVHFRGMSSFMMVSEGYKRSLNVSLDFVDNEQRLGGYRTLNLLNCSGDPSMMSSALYAHLARKFLPVPQANFVKVVINGESWGVFVNSQQFNKDFVKEHFGTSAGSRWKVRGNPAADGGLRYLGDDLDQYKERFQIKSKDTKKAWLRLIELCRILEQTPPEKLETELESMVDVNQLLWFLALDVASVNSAGYWTRASDYSLYLDEQDTFHVIPHDVNEAFHGSHGGGAAGFGPPPGFRPPGGFGPPEEPGQPNGERNEDTRPRRRNRGGFGPPNEGGIDLDPLVNIENPRMPLRSKVLAVPRLRQQYLQNVREIAEQMSWDHVGPFVRRMRELIDEEVKADTRKLSTYEAFVEATRDDASGAETGLRHFFEARRSFLLAHPKIAALPKLSESADRPKKSASVKSAALSSQGVKGLIINEIMADNDSIKDPDGDFDDWIELHNFSNQEIDLTDISLSDHENDLRRWIFPSGTKIGPHQFLLIWADDDVESKSGLHANFKLSKDGESVYLSRRNGTENKILDQVTFGRQKPGDSFGKHDVGSSKWTRLVPTPGETNRTN